MHRLFCGLSWSFWWQQLTPLPVTLSSTTAKKVNNKEIKFYVIPLHNISNTLIVIVAPMVRVRRDDKYVAAASGGSYGKGHVGPVYTFVKTDPKANFKWGVRHRAGAQYGR